MDINRNAPVHTTQEIEIAANPEVVWDVLTDIAHWPAWNKDITWVNMNGALTEGTTFNWKAGPGTIQSTLQNVNPTQEIVWTGTTLGINAVDAFHLERHADHTIVREEESWEGLIVHLFRGSMQGSLEKSIHAGLQYLKAEAERRASQ